MGEISWSQYKSLERPLSAPRDEFTGCSNIWCRFYLPISIIAVINAKAMHDFLLRSPRVGAYA